MKRKCFWVLSVLMIVALTACPQDPAKVLQDAEAQRLLGKTDSAIKKYLKVIELEPGNSVAHLGLGLALLDKGNKSEAKSSLNNAIKLGDPPEVVAQAHEKMGDIANDAGDPLKAIEHYRRATGVDKNKLMTTRIALVKTLVAKNDQKAAATHLLDLMQGHATDPNVIALLEDPSTADARSHLRANFLDAAEKEIKAENFKKALTLLGKSEDFPAEAAEAGGDLNIRAKSLWAAAHSELGHCDTAAKLWSEVLDVSKDKTSEANFYDIVCSMRANNLVDALRRFEKIGDKNPFHRRAQALIPRILKKIKTEKFKVPLEKAHVRAGPSLKYKIIDKWPLAHEVRVIAKEDKNWYRINYKGERSAFMHRSVITDRQIAINVKGNGWEQAETEGGLAWMLAFKPYAKLKITNLGTEPITSITLKMIIKEGRKIYSSDKFRVNIPEEKLLKPDKSILKKITSGANKELLTRPDKAYIIIYASVEGGDYEIYREFFLDREVVDEEG